MKIKFLAIIASFFILPLAITSCLNSDDDYELGSDDTISAFGLDAIYGVNYKFTIDQVRGEIYNQDSVPYGSDTIINKILVKTLTTGGYVITGDTFFIMSDSVDFLQTMPEPGVIEPLEFEVHAANGESKKTYKIWVNRHQVDPDSLVWGNVYAESFSNPVITENQETKTIPLGNDILIYTTDISGATLCYSKNNQWSSSSTNLPLNAKVGTMINFKDELYIVANNLVYRSSDGSIWEEIENLLTWDSDNFKVESLITTFYANENGTLIEKTIAGIITDDEGVSFSFANATFDESRKLLTWTKGEEVPKKEDHTIGFPMNKFSAIKSFATPTGGQQAMLMGSPLEDEAATTLWFSLDGLDWGVMETTSDYSLPKWKEPTILHYGGLLYAFGGAYDADSENDFGSIYTSESGFLWTEIERGFLFPNEDWVSKFEGRKGYSVTVDKDNYIWMVWGKGASTNDEVWRGRLTRLTFDKQ